MGRLHQCRSIASVKRLVPPKQLHVLTLENGYGWEAICPYLGIPIPDVPWPKLNSTEEFKEFTGPMFKRAAFNGVVAVVSFSLCIIGLGWALQTGRLQLPFAIVRN
jgi:hypothetical protein